MSAWSYLGTFDPPGDGWTHRTYSDGRLIIQAPGAVAARGIEEVARVHEDMHGEGREALMLAVCETLPRGLAAGPEPWAPNNPATEKGREDLRRAGFEETHDPELGTVWVRPADGKTLKPRKALFVVPVELDPRGGGYE
ncbi:hypothetical protein GBA63_22640 (plasmid) [Rubrobacter tropicus]|uniref:Uncharacterized protein n=1 Tax=Rubrobacter tropicus TaxID=2653851 RepID=A0A6G8QGB3_9ACTN|nr:hypothetical protein [Rubrobacter tropicus]QIN85498.1 hypothetical protein GBA63_22640 [Rubrobacter tropicus]